jgi:hypothetical protein
MMTAFVGTRTDHLGRIIGGDGRPVNLATLQQGSTTTESSRDIARQQAQERLNELRDTWNLGFDLRQREAEANANRAFGYRRQETDQNFQNNRTLRGDELQSIERRDTAQIAARERMQQAGFGQERDIADLRSRIKQREKSEDRTAAIAAFRNRR